MTTPIGALALQPDGKIIAGAGTTLARFTPNGTLDTTFGGDGQVTAAFEVAALALQPDGKIVTAGNADDNFGLARYNPNGTLDTTFSGDGTVTTDSVSALERSAP